jgi:hypothetical protein
MNFEPRKPNLMALACTCAFVLLLCAPMFAGRFLIGPDSDSFVGGYAFRAFWTDYVRAHGAVPQWDPYIFGGLPFVAATHGDTFHPIVLLRLVLPTDMAMNASFLIHLILAGFFTYLFLRGFGLPWVAAVAGGIAYQLTGQVASLVNSGHDGKIIVSSLLPLALWGLTRWIRDGRWTGVGTVAASVGLAILSPQLQSSYYLLLTSGLFALYLAFFDPDRPARRLAVLRLGGALGAVALGSAMAALQVLPFLQYIPYSPRGVAGESTGWEHAISWAMPPEELLNTLLPQFSGLRNQYSGGNVFKHHTEYLGVVTLVLATIGLTQTARARLRWAFVALAAFFLTFALAGATPFFRIWYAILPMVAKARAHSMAFYVVSFAVAVWAAFGVERVLQRERQVRGLTAWLIALGVIVLFAVAGVFTNLERTIAAAAGQAWGDPDRVARAVANQSAVVLGALRIAVFGAATIGLLFAWGRGRLRPVAFATLLLVLLGFDLYSIDRQFFVFSPRAAQLYPSDPITERIAATPKPYRVLDVPQAPVYDGSNLMLYGIPQVLGYHSFQIRYYDELLGGKGQWRNLFTSLHLWKLLAIRYVTASDSIHLPGYHKVLGPVRAATGRTAYLYEADSTPPYARVIPAGVKGEADRIVPTLIDPRLDYDRLVLFAPDEAVNPLPVDSMPAPSPARAHVAAWEAGRMTITLDPTPPSPSYVLVAENWYLDWRATVDGADAPVLRGDQTFITVPVPAGAHQVELVYRSSRYRTGRLISIFATLIVVGCLVGPPIANRFARRG